MAKSKTTVLYIAGVGRSGSTLLGRVIGQSENAEFVGEAKNIDRQASSPSRCGCGEDIRSCSLWSHVLEEIDVEAVRKARVEFRVRDLAFGLPSVEGPVDQVARYYHILRRESGAQVIVDSSKFPSYLLYLSESPEIDLRILHLVRDPRAVAYSWWGRPLHEGKEDLPLPGRSFATFKYENPIRSSLIWLLWNWIIDKHWGDRTYYQMSYEDFCVSPRTEIRRALDGLGVRTRPEWISEHEIDLPSQHSVLGNPNRFTEGVVRIETRDQWREKLSRPLKWLVTALTLPLLKRYGYSPIEGV